MQFDFPRRGISVHFPRYAVARNEAGSQLSHYFSISPARSTRISWLSDTSRANMEERSAARIGAGARETEQGREREREG